MGWGGRVQVPSGSAGDDRRLAVHVRRGAGRRACSLHVVLAYAHGAGAS